MTTRELNLFPTTYAEMGEGYRHLYDEIFSEPYDGAHVPANILLGTDGEIVIGMLAYYVHDLGTAYIQYGGFRKHWQGRPVNLAWLQQAIVELHRSYPHLLAEVRADNNVALRYALKADFHVTGTRLDSSGQLLVHLLHEGTHGFII